MFIHQYMIIWNKVRLKTPSSGLHHSTKHTMSVLHHCWGHELITGVGRNLLQTRAFARGVRYTRLSWCLQAFCEKERKTTNKRHPSVRGLLSSGWREKQKERVRRWNEKKTVTGAAHEAWQRLMTQRRKGHRRHGYSGLSWWSHTLLNVCAFAYVRWCLTASLFNANCSRQTPASSDIIVCVYLSF